MASELFGIAYANIVALNYPQSGTITIDAGSFADSGETPPVAWSATQSNGQFLIGGLYSSVTSAACLNPNYVPPTG